MVVTKEEGTRIDNQTPDQNVLSYVIPERLQGPARIRFAQNRLSEISETITADSNIDRLLDALELAQQIFHMHCSLDFNPIDIHRGMIGSEQIVYSGVVSVFRDALDSEHAEVAYLAATYLLSLNEANDQLFQVFSQPRMLDLSQDFLDGHTNGRDCIATLRDLVSQSLTSNPQDSWSAIRALGDLASNSETSPEHLISILNCFQSILTDLSGSEAVILTQLQRISQSRTQVLSQLSSSLYPIIDMFLESQSPRPDHCFLLSTILDRMPSRVEGRTRRLEQLRGLFTHPENVPLARAHCANHIRTFTDRSFIAQLPEESLYHDASQDDLPPTMARATERALEIIRQCEWIPSEIRESFFQTPPLFVVDNTLGESAITGNMIAGCHIPGTNLIFLASRSVEAEASESVLLHRALHECFHYMDHLAGGNMDIAAYLRSGRNNTIAYTAAWVNEGLCELFNNRGLLGVNVLIGSTSYPNEVGVVLYIERLLETSAEGRTPSELLFRAFLTDDFTEVQRQINLRLGENAFERLMACRNGAEAVVAITEMMENAHISYFNWSNSNIVREIAR